MKSLTQRALFLTLFLLPVLGVIAAPPSSMQFNAFPMDEDYAVRASYDYRDLRNNVLDCGKFTVVKRKGIVVYAYFKRIDSSGFAKNYSKEAFEVLCDEKKLLLVQEGRTFGQNFANVYDASQSEKIETEILMTTQPLTGMNRLAQAMEIMSAKGRASAEALSKHSYRLVEDISTSAIALQLDLRQPVKQITLFETDTTNRVTSVKYTYNPKLSLLPERTFTFSYDEGSTVPKSLTSKYDCDFVTYPEQKWTVERFSHGEAVTKMSIKPELLKTNTVVLDHRFTPPLRYETTSDKLLDDNALFALAARNKAEVEAANKLAAKTQQAAADPRNIPPTAPVVGESWTKRLRQIPNWAYLSVIGAIALIWGAARLRRKK